MKQHRNTKQRQMVLDAVTKRFDHPTADEIYLDVRALDDKISRGTVYRNLNALVDQGELRRVKVSEADRFEAQLDRHYHFACKECGEVTDCPISYDDKMDEEMSAKTDNKVEGHRTVFEGVCSKCQKNADDLDK